MNTKKPQSSSSAGTVGVDAFRLATRSGDEITVRRALAQSLPKFDATERWKALRVAASSVEGHVSVLGALLDHSPRADVNVRFAHGRLQGCTYAHTVVMCNRTNPIAMLSQLVERGADLSLAIRDGRTVLHLAMDREQWTSWRVAALVDPRALLEWLLAHGAEPCLTMCSKGQRTPLTYAIESGLDVAKHFCRLVEQIRERIKAALAVSLRHSEAAIDLVVDYAFDFDGETSLSRMVLALQDGDWHAEQHGLAQLQRAYATPRSPRRPAFGVNDAVLVRSPHNAGSVMGTLVHVAMVWGGTRPSHTPLVLARLVALGADLTARMDDGRTVLHLVVDRYGGDTLCRTDAATRDMLDWLLERGAAPCLLATHQGHTPALWAAQNGHPFAVVRHFVDAVRKWRLRYASAVTAGLGWLLPSRATAAAEAAVLPIILDCLLGVETSFLTPEAFFDAVKRSDASVCELALIQPTPIPINFHREPDGATALHLAHGPAMVSLLLAHLADVHARDRCGRTAVHAHVVQQCAPHAWLGPVGLIAVLEPLVAHGADLNAVDGAGRSVFHLMFDAALLAEAEAETKSTAAAAAAADTDTHVYPSYPCARFAEVALWLLAHGAHPGHAPHEFWVTARQWFTLLRAADLPSLELALTQPTPVSTNQTSFDGMQSTALHVANASTSYMAALLLTHGANVDARDAEGRTPVHTALVHSRANGLAWLYERLGVLHVHGADLAAVDALGRSVFHYALTLWGDDHGFAALSVWLVAHGAAPALTAVAPPWRASNSEELEFPGTALALAAARPRAQYPALTEFIHEVRRVREAYFTTIGACIDEAVGVGASVGSEARTRTPQHALTRLVLEYGFDCIGVVTERFWWSAVVHDDAEVVERGLTQPHMRVDPHATELGLTALHVAAVNLSVDVLRVLLEWRADVNAVGETSPDARAPLLRSTPLHLLMEYGEMCDVPRLSRETRLALVWPAVELLLRHGAAPSLFAENAQLSTPLERVLFTCQTTGLPDLVYAQMHAIRAGYRACLEGLFIPPLARLIDQYTFDDSQFVVTRRAIRRAARCGDLPTVQRGVEQPRIWWIYGGLEQLSNLILRDAAQHAQPHVVAWVLKHPQLALDPDTLRCGYNGHTALHAAVHGPGHFADGGQVYVPTPEACDLVALDSEGAKPGIDGLVAVLEALHDGGADMCASTLNGKTVVHLAVQRWGRALWTGVEARSVLDWLLCHGAKPCLFPPYQYGFTPLDLAVANGWDEVVAYLKAHTV